MLLQRECPEARVAVLSGNKEITSKLCMRADKRFPLTTGGNDCRLPKDTVMLNLQCLISELLPGPQLIRYRGENNHRSGKKVHTVLGGCSMTCSSSGGNSVLRTAGEGSSSMKPSLQL